MIRSLPAPAVVDALLAALESAGLGCTIFLERDGRRERVYANAVLAEIYGMDLDVLRESPPLALGVVAPEARARFSQERAKVSPDTPWPAFLESVIMRPDGARVPIEVVVGYCTIEGARATCAFVRNVTAKATMAAALRESEQRFRSVAEVSRDSITIVSNGRFTYANPTALERFGVKRLEELPAHDLATRGVEELAPFKEHRRSLERGESPPPIEHRATTPDGGERILETALSLTSLDGAPAVISYTRDITERVHLQAELMKRDRMASVGVLAAGVAHELNNPLTSLGLQVRKLRGDADRHGLSPEVRDALGQIDEGARRMQTIIADLLFMARPVDQPQAHVDVAQILASTIALVQAGTTGAPKMTVTIGELPSIHGYASKLGQVFMNILRNSVQALESRADGEIEVRARPCPEAIEIDIEDNGGGIPADVMPNVMRPFFTTKSDGTGLGLWISQTIIGQHGGTLDVASTEGVGTTVRIHLPVRFPPA